MPFFKPKVCGTCGFWMPNGEDCYNPLCRECIYL